MKSSRQKQEDPEKKAEKQSMVIKSFYGNGLVSESERIKQMIREALAEQKKENEKMLDVCSRE